MEKTACPSSYVVVDLETTGLYPSQDRILEIGAVKVLDGEVADTFCMFADPQMKIPEKIRELTGITQEMVAGQPTPAEAVRAFLDFCGELDLMGHNLIFDYSFLKHQAADQKIPFEKNGKVLSIPVTPRVKVVSNTLITKFASDEYKIKTIRLDINILSHCPNICFVLSHISPKRAIGKTNISKVFVN